MTGVQTWALPIWFRAKPYSLEDFAEKTLKALDIDKADISERTRSFVEANFSCERHMKILEETIRELT